MDKGEKHADRSASEFIPEEPPALFPQGESA
jgi:hypothetical protein